jgi:preprotein translocase subunit SecF
MDITWHIKHLSANQMIAISLILPLLSAGVLVVRYVATGTPVPLSSDFKSGTLIRVQGLNIKPNADNVGKILSENLNTSVSVAITTNTSLTTGQFGFDAEVGLVIPPQDNEVTQFLENNFIDNIAGASSQILGRGSVIATLSRNQAIEAIIGAFIGMTIVLFIAFGNSTAVGVMVLCVAFDALGALGGMALFKVPLSFGSVAALLMIIGYSVDTDIILSNHMLKRVGGDVRERAANGMTTGVMTQGTTIVALITIDVIMHSSSLLFELATVLIFGIISDTFNTWFLNVGVLLRNIEHKQRREYYVSD